MLRIGGTSAVPGPEGFVAGAVGGDDQGSNVGNFRHQRLVGEQCLLDADGVGNDGFGNFYVIHNALSFSINSWIQVSNR